MWHETWIMGWIFFTWTWCFLWLGCSSSSSNAFPTFVLKDKYVFSSNFYRQEKGGRNKKKRGWENNFFKKEIRSKGKKALKQTFLHMIKVRVNYKSFIHIIASNMGNLLLMSSLKALWFLHKFRNNKRFSLNAYNILFEYH